MEVQAQQLNGFTIWPEYNCPFSFHRNTLKIHFTALSPTAFLVNISHVGSPALSLDWYEMYCCLAFLFYVSCVQVNKDLQAFSQEVWAALKLEETKEDADSQAIKDMTRYLGSTSTFCCCSRKLYHKKAHRESIEGTGRNWGDGFATTPDIQTQSICKHSKLKLTFLHAQASYYWWRAPNFRQTFAVNWSTSSVENFEMGKNVQLLLSGFFLCIQF